MRLFLILLSVLMIAAPAHAETIAAIVNQDAISMSDLNDRIDLTIISSGLPNNPEIRAKLTPQILSALIEEQLKLQEAERLKIDVTQDEINSGFSELAQQNNIPPEHFIEMIKKSGINIETMKRQIRAQIGWGKTIQQTMRPQVTISDSDIDDYIQRINANKGKTEYLVAEIFLTIDKDNPESTVQELAGKLVAEINKGAPFMKVAQQFSAAPGAAAGGDRGWVQQGSLAPELDNALHLMAKGTVSPPIRTTGGYHILLLRDVRTITEQSIPPREKIVSILGVQRLERMQARHLLDLKSTAFIETRA